MSVTPTEPIRRRRASTPRWTSSLREQIAIRVETHNAAKLIRKDIGLSDVRSIDDMVELVARRRGTPITVLYLALPSKVSAFCISTPEQDFVVVDTNASELTQLHAILHELGHFLLDDADGHTDTLDADEFLPRELAQQLVPNLNPDEVTRYFKRSHYASKTERRVEALATVLLERHLELRRTDFEGLTAILTHRRTGV